MIYVCALTIHIEFVQVSSNHLLEFVSTFDKLGGYGIQNIGLGKIECGSKFRQVKFPSPTIRFVEDIFAITSEACGFTGLGQIRQLLICCVRKVQATGEK